MVFARHETELVSFAFDSNGRSYVNTVILDLESGSGFGSDNIAILNVYALNNRASNNFRQKMIELQGKLEQSTTIVGDFNTCLSGMGRWSRQKIIKGTVGLKSTINQLDTTDIS